MKEEISNVEFFNRTNCFMNDMLNAYMNSLNLGEFYVHPETDERATWELAVYSDSITLYDKDNDERAADFYFDKDGNLEHYEVYEYYDEGVQREWKNLVNHLTDEANMPRYMMEETVRYCQDIERMEKQIKDLRQTEKNDDNKIEVKRDYYDNGQIKTEWGEKEGGQQEGVAKWWYQNGKLMSETHWKNDEMHGSRKGWHENGVLSEESHWKNGVEDGMKRTWYENGQMESCGNFKAGEPDGVWKTWFENGQLWCEEIFDCGHRVSLKEWNEDGLTGYKISYHNNGEKKEMREIVNGNENGKYEGMIQEWHPNGVLSYEANYKNGVPDGVEKIYHENGKLAYESTYKEGKLEGVSRSWYENGKLHVEENYKNGKNEGMRRRWNDKGELEFEAGYKDGRLVSAPKTVQAKPAVEKPQQAKKKGLGI